MDTATLTAGFATVIAAINLIWSIRSLTKIQKDVEHSNRLHDQSVQRLYRAREAVIAWNQTQIYIMQYNLSGKEQNDNYLIKASELSAAYAELRGIAIAIGDDHLYSLVNVDIHAEYPLQQEAKIMGKAQDLHTRITELLEMATHV